MANRADDWTDNRPERISMFVSEEPKSFRVTYKGDKNKRFRVNIVQKPNPIGFTARIPGDKRYPPTASQATKL